MCVSRRHRGGRFRKNRSAGKRKRRRVVDDRLGNGTQRTGEKEQLDRLTAPAVAATRGADEAPRDHARCANKIVALADTRWGIYPIEPNNKP